MAGVLLPNQIPEIDSSRGWGGCHGLGSAGPGPELRLEVVAESFGFGLEPGRGEPARGKFLSARQFQGADAAQESFRDEMAAG
jgi:hypothetical protein